MRNEAALAIDGMASVEVAGSPGQKLLEALRRGAGGGSSALAVESPCGGRGRCGKCRLRASGALSPPGERETALLSARELAEGWRLACLAEFDDEASEATPVLIELAPSSAASILTEGPALDIVPDPPARRLLLRLEAPRLDRQLSDTERLYEALASSGFPAKRISLPALRALASAAREEGLSVVVSEGTVIEVAKAGQAPAASYGLGVDIGTTTLACYLVDLDSGALRGKASALNPQRSFGADVISRIAATIDRSEGLSELRDLITRQVEALARELLFSVGAGPESLLSIAVAGNTTMLHLFAGLHPGAIAASPFSPVFTETLAQSASDFGLDFPASTRLWLLPGVAAYVGADIVAGLAALGMAEREGPCLLLDIGTNGELALGDCRGILCCATAAGPAFEGAGIEMGMGGVAGAIDAVWLDGDDIAFSTIGGEAARGLCGSGVLDALAAFLDAGLVDDSGRILDGEEAAALGPALASLRVEGPSGPRLLLGSGIYLSQADVRSLQLATAAIAAGIEILLARAGKRPAELEAVYLAGGFGSFLELKSALRVGLIPKELGDKVVVVGNSSGAGAAAACLSRARLAACELARSRCSYVELSSSPEFNDRFVEHLFFPGPG